MKAAPAKKPIIRIAVVESDPLRFVGFRALFESEPDLEVIAESVSDLATLTNILKAVASGAKGYVDNAASAAEFVQAVRVVNQGSVWVPRRVLSTFIERVSSAPDRIFPTGRDAFTDRLGPGD